MRYLLTFILLLFASSAFANSAQLAWDASPSPDVVGYVLYYGQDDTALEYSKDVGTALETTVDGLSTGTWYFAVTAYNATSESDYSNMVNFTQEGFVPPENIHIPITKPATVNITISVE